MKTYRCSDGVVVKTISAASAKEAAESYAIVTSDVDVVEVDSDGDEISDHQSVSVEIND